MFMVILEGFYAFGNDGIPDMDLRIFLDVPCCNQVTAKVRIDGGYLFGMTAVEDLTVLMAIVNDSKVSIRIDDVAVVVVKDSAIKPPVIEAVGELLRQTRSVITSLKETTETHLNRVVDSLWV
jgi:hypothetical protein